jgi:hypothetical protein
VERSPRNFIDIFIHNILYQRRKKKMDSWVERWMMDLFALLGWEEERVKALLFLLSSWGERTNE